MDLLLSPRAHCHCSFWEISAQKSKLCCLEWMTVEGILLQPACVLELSWGAL